MAEAKKNILTQEGLKTLEDELQDLKVVKRKEVAQKIKDEQRDIEARIEELEQILKNAEVIDEEFQHGVISLGCLVKLEDLTFKEEVTYHIVGSTEADILNNKISNEAPIGKALLGAKIGDVVEVEGVGQVNQYKVLDVKRK